MTTANVFGIVPVKGLHESKMRLSTVLGPDRRRTLTRVMIENVLDALKESAIKEVLVVSPDLSVREIADEHNVSFLRPKVAGLNPSLREAIEWCLKKNAESILILPADLPLASSEDVARLLDLGSEESIVVVAPSADGGTNALLLRPPNVIPVCFGPGSFYEHVKEALEKDVPLRFYFSQGVMLDVDSEDDLKKLLEFEGCAESKKVVTQILLLMKNAEG